MTENFNISEIPDADWDKLTGDQQKSYNSKIAAKSEYNEAKHQYDISMSMSGPCVLALIGVPAILIFGAGILLIIIALIWLFMRISSRAQAYQRFKDAEAALKAAMAENV